MATWTNSQPCAVPFWRWLLWPARLPVMRCPIALIDVDMDDLAGCGALVAGAWLGGLDGREQAQSAALQDTADGGRREAEFGGDRGLGTTLAAQGLDGIASGGRGLAWR